MDNREKICKGCRGFKRNLCFTPPSIPITKYTPEGLICPCSTCLVKGICNGIDCDMLDKYEAMSRFIKKNVS